jgi:hypothetical protein
VGDCTQSEHYTRGCERNTKHTPTKSQIITHDFPMSSRKLDLRDPKSEANSYRSSSKTASDQSPTHTKRSSTLRQSTTSGEESTGLAEKGMRNQQRRHDNEQQRARSEESNSRREQLPQLEQDDFYRAIEQCSTGKSLGGTRIREQAQDVSTRKGRVDEGGGMICSGEMGKKDRTSSACSY